MAIYPAMVSLIVDAAKNATRDLLAAQGAGTSIWVHGIFVTGNADGTVEFIDSTPTSHTGAIPVFVAGRQDITWPLTGGDDPYFKCAENTKLQVTLSVNTDLDGLILYSVQAS